MEKEINIQTPEGYEIDYENSTFKCIKFKEKEEIRTWEDYKKKYGDFTVTIYSKININDEKFKKHLAAEIKIKLLMSYYGKEITIEEWRNPHIFKYTIISNSIISNSFKILRSSTITNYSFLAFHTRKQRDEFIKYNEQLIKDYFMLND